MEGGDLQEGTRERRKLEDRGNMEEMKDVKEGIRIGKEGENGRGKEVCRSSFPSTGVPGPVHTSVGTTPSCLHTKEVCRDTSVPLLSYILGS